MQSEILELVKTHGVENLSVVLGISDAEAVGLTTECLRKGDPTFSGALAGVSLELDVHHVFELEKELSAEAYQRIIGIYDRILDKKGILEELSWAKGYQK